MIRQLGTGCRVCGSNPGGWGGEIFRTRPDRPWDPPSSCSIAVSCLGRLSSQSPLPTGLDWDPPSSCSIAVSCLGRLSSQSPLPTGLDTGSVPNDLGAMEKKIISCPRRKSMPDSLAVHSVVSLLCQPIYPHPKTALATHDVNNTGFVRIT